MLTIDKLHKHTHLVVLVSAVAALWAVIKFSTQPQLQFMILTCLVLLYLSWAILFHLKDKSLTLEVMLEYILTATLALVFFYGILI